MVLFQTHVPGEAAHGRHTLELVNYVARDKVDVIIVELDTSVADSLSPQLIEFSIIHPLHTLERERENKVYYCGVLFKLVWLFLSLGRLGLDHDKSHFMELLKWNVCI